MHKLLPYFVVFFFLIGSLSFCDGLHPMVYAIQAQLQLFTLACIAYVGSKELVGAFVLYTGYIATTDWMFSEVHLGHYIVEVAVFFVVLTACKLKIWKKDNK